MQLTHPKITFFLSRNMLYIFLSGLDLLIIKLQIFSLRLTQDILLLMVYICQILLYTVILLGALYISLLLIQILHMLFMLLVSLLLLLLPFIEQQFFVFYDIFRVQSFRVFYFHLALSQSCVHTQMLIMTIIPQIISLLLVYVSFQVIFLYFERVRNNLLFFNLQPKQNIIL